MLPELAAGKVDDASFRLLADHLPTLCWIANGNGYIVWYNRRWHDYCGTTPEQMEGWGWTSVHHPDHLDAVLARWQASIAAGAPFEMTFPLRGADGTYRPFLTRIVPVRDASGAVVRWCGVNTDVSDQIAAEEALRAERDRAQSVLDGMDEAFLLLDRDLFIRDINAKALSYETRPREAFVGKRLGEAWPGSEEAEQGALYRRVLHDRLPRSLAALYRWEDGRSGWFEINAHPIRGGVAVFYRDITGQKAANDALRRSGEQAAALAAEREAVLGQLAEGVIVTDTNGRITFVNEAAERLHGVKLLGVPPEEYSRAYSLLTEDGRPYPPRALPLARAVLDGETVVDARWRIRRAGAPDVLAIGSARPIRDTGGGQSGAVLTVRDDTERMRAELDLRELNETLERRVAAAIAERVEDQARLAEAEAALRQSQKMEAVGQLTGGIAHDFNNLLTIVLGNLDLGRRLLGKGGDAGRIERVLGSAQRGAERAAALTQRLLAFSRRQPLLPKPTDVARLLAGMSELLARALGETIGLELRPEPDLPGVEVDPNQLESALLNLAVNARDAMPEGGRLTVSAAARRVEAGGDAPAVVTPNDYVAITVADTGSGMSPEVAARAFEPFFTTKDVGRGTGLGLSMVYGFSRQSKGHVTIDTAEGQGTAITLWLPALGDAATADAERETPSPANAGGGGRVVLVVEDDPDVRAYTVGLVGELGYQVLEAENGGEALALLDRPIDLLLTDVVMPGMSGSALAEAARARRPDLPVLFTSGYTRDALVHDGRLDAGVDLLLKPFTLEVLAGRLEKAFTARGGDAGA